MLRAPATVVVGGIEATILLQSTSSVTFEYPAALAPGPQSVTVERGGALSNAVPITIKAPGEGQQQGLGGPMADQYQFKVDHVIDLPFKVRRRPLAPGS